MKQDDRKNVLKNHAIRHDEGKRMKYSWNGSLGLIEPQLA